MLSNQLGHTCELLKSPYYTKEGLFLYAKNLPAELPGYSLVISESIVHSTVENF